MFKPWQLKERTSKNFRFFGSIFDFPFKFSCDLLIVLIIPDWVSIPGRKTENEILAITSDLNLTTVNTATNMRLRAQLRE
jgi:hypothetical protein